MIALSAKVRVQGKNDFHPANIYSMDSTATKSEISFVPDLRGGYDRDAPCLEFKVTLAQSTADKLKLGNSYTVIFVGTDDE